MISFNLGMHDGGDDAPVARVCLSARATAEPAGALEGQGDRHTLEPVPWSQSHKQRPLQPLELLIKPMVY